MTVFNKYNRKKDSLVVSDFAIDIFKIKELGIDKTIIFRKNIKSKMKQVPIESLVKIKGTSQKHTSLIKEKKINWPNNAPLSLVEGEELVIPPDHSFKLEKLLCNAALLPETRGIQFVNAENIANFLSYKALHEKVRKRAFNLKDSGIRKGEAIIIQYHENEEFLITFWALIFLGAIPTPMGVLKDVRIDSSDVKRLKDVIELLDFPKILCDTLQEEKLKNVLPVWQDLFEDGYKENAVINTDKLTKEGGLDPDYDICCDTVTLHLLTSGTTGKPKCVQQSHRTLCHHVVIISEGYKLTEDSVYLNWMPLDHVGGIVMSHLQAVYNQCQQVQVNVNLFGAQPLRWLDWIEKYKVTHTWSPNFSFNIITQHVHNVQDTIWDLSSLKSILNGGEQVTAPVCQNFLKVLAKYDLNDRVMQPGWGMSETSSALTINDKISTFNKNDGVQTIGGFTEEGVVIPIDKDAVNKQTLVEIGRPLPGVKIRIVNDKMELLPHGVKGKLQISSPTLMVGYRNNDKANKETFVEEGWLDTGDIAFMVNNSVTISGREKDIIIIKGVNYACYDIEEICESVFGVEDNWSVASSIPNKDGSDILAIYFVCSGTETGFISNVITQIKEKITLQLGITPELIIPVEKKDIPKTNIGKKQRAAVIKSYLNNNFSDGERFYTTNNSSKGVLPNWFLHPTWEEKEMNFVSNSENKILVWSKNSEWNSGKDIKVFKEWSELIIELKESKINNNVIIDLTNTDGELEFEFLRICKALDGVQHSLERIIVLSKNRIPYSKKEEVKVSGISGLIKTIPHEFEQVQFAGLLDVQSLNRETITLAIQEVNQEHQDAIVIIREHKRYVFALEKPVSIETGNLIHKELPLENEGFYLITGGLGGVGFRLAQFLVKEYKAKILISGRKEEELLSGKALERWHVLKSISKDIYYTTIDITDYNVLEKEIKQLENQYERVLNGVFHFAGIIQEILLKDITEVELQEMYRAKVHGTVSLAQLLENRAECLLITTSSARAIKSGMTVGTYVAASDFVENYTTQLFQEGKKVYCFSWSLWEGIGMGEDLAIKQVLASKGYIAMPAKKAFISMLVGLKLAKPVTYIGLDSSAIGIHELLLESSNNDEVDTLFFTADDNSIEITSVLKVIEKEKNGEVPLHVLRIKQFPYTDNGELDVKRIENLLIAEQKEFEAPETNTEIELAELWKNLLNTESISKTDNFFALGGDSLKATRLLSCIKERFNTTVKIEQLFELAELYALANLIENNSQIRNEEKIPKEERGSYPYELAMSLAQKKQWFTYVYAPDSPLYVNAFSLKFEGKLDEKALQFSLNKIVERHEGLRTCFSIDSNGELWQKIHEPYNVELPIIDLSALFKEEQEIKVEALRKEESNTIFHLEYDRMLRCKLLHFSEHKNELVFSMHHIVSDGWSAGVFVRDLQTFYEKRVEEIESVVQTLEFQPTDFGVWQENNYQTGVYDESITYWKRQLSGVPHVLDFPFDYIRPASQSYLGKARVLSLSSTLSNKLKDFSERRGCTLYMTMMSAFAILMQRYSRQEELVLGSLIANRQNATLEKMIGFFVNTLVINFNMFNELSFEEFLQQTKQTVLNAWKHQNLPFDRLIEELDIEREAAVHPIFQFLFVQQNAHEQKVDLGTVKGDFIIHDQDATRFDLECHIFDKKNHVDIKIIYNTDLFNRDTITQLLEQYETVLEAVIMNPSLAISEQNILPKKQEKRILNVWNKKINEIEEKTVQDLWYRQVEKNKNAVALKGLKRNYTYEWVDDFTENLAGHLQSKGIKSGTLIGLLFDREDELYLSILAIVKLGGVYVPIDSSYPEERLKWILENTKTPILLCSKHLEEKAKAYSKEIMVIDVDITYDGVVLNRDEIIQGTEQPMYVNYTSGSTGKPKGVVIPQRGVLRTIVDNGYCDINEKDSFLQLGNPSFDTFTLEIWGAWLYGGRLVVIKKEDILDIEKLASVLEEEQITGGFMTVTLFNSLVEYKPESIKSYKYLLVGGEAISVSHVKKALDYLPKGLMNGYGPTENSVFTTTYVINEVKDRQTSIPIGVPMRDSKVYILNERKELVPPGVPGLIFGGGKGVALSYLNNPEATNEKFIPDTFTKKGLMYNTGDLGRWLPDGSIEYLGRTDNQVKIRGHRIECGEIETILNAYPEVKHSVVQQIQNASGNKKLASWIVFKGESKIEELQIYISNQLPGYMIPSYFTVINKVPLNNNGKVDKKALPKPEIQTASTKNFVKPKNEKEQILVSVWKEVLGMDQLSIKDSFFELGADSIIIIQMISKLIMHGYRLKPKQVFQLKTIEKLAKMMEPIRKGQQVDQGKISGEIPLGEIQKWFFDFNKEHYNYWNLPVLISLDNVPEKVNLTKALNELVIHHDLLRAKFYKDENENWKQFISETIKPIAIEYVKIENNKEDEKRIHAQKIQQSLLLETGVLCRVVVYILPQEKVELFICMHHLVVDGISWRILVEDLITLLEKPDTVLPLKTSSFRDWIEAIENYKNNELKEQKGYWDEIQDALESQNILPELNFSSPDTEANASEYLVVLSKDETQKLINKTHQTYKTEYNDILITALSRAMHDITLEDKLIVTLEGHGREDISEKIDISRTVGWFTTAFPVIFTNKRESILREQILATKNTIRSIPEKGLGYGLLTYNKTVHQVCFNYLGRLDQSGQAFELAPNSTGMYHDPEAIRPYPIELNCWINNNIFEAKINVPGYTSKYDVLGERFIYHLAQIIEHCSTTDEYSYQASDFDSVTLTEEELTVLPSGIKDVYPLTMNQEGMLYQHINYPDAKVYFSQVKQELKGKIDIPILEKAIQQVVQTYDSLKTQFLWEGLNKPLQLIHNTVKIELQYSDLSKKEDRDVELNEILDSDMNNLFNLSELTTPRFHLINFQKEESILLMSFHHILLDGWSLFLVINSIIDTYHNISKNFSYQIEVKSANTFKDFILNYSKAEIKESFWKKYLRGIEPLPDISIEIREKGLKQKVKQNTIIIDEQKTDALKKLAVNKEITLNTIIQTAWSLALAQFKGDNDVVYGTTFSARLPEIKDVQKITGMLINSLPLRVNLHNQYETIIEVSKRIQNTLIDLQEHQLVELNESYIAANLDTSKQYFDSILVFENYVNEANVAHDLIQLGEVKAYEHTNFPLSVVVVPEEEMTIRISYQESVYNQKQIQELLKYLQHIIDFMLSNIEKTIADSMPKVIETNTEISRKNVKIDTLYEDQKEVYSVLEKEEEAQVFILNNNFQQIKGIDKPGEIYLIVKNPLESCGEWGEWMEENKIENPFDIESYLYPTGDIGQWNEDFGIQILELKEY